MTPERLSEIRRYAKNGGYDQGHPLAEALEHAAALQAQVDALTRQLREDRETWDRSIRSANDAESEAQARAEALEQEVERLRGEVAYLRERMGAARICLMPPPKGGFAEQALEILSSTLSPIPVRTEEQCMATHHPSQAKNCPSCQSRSIPVSGEAKEAREFLTQCAACNSWETETTATRVACNRCGWDEARTP